MSLGLECVIGGFLVTNFNKVWRGRRGIESQKGIPWPLARVFKNRLKYDLKSNQIICRKYDLKSQSNRHFQKRFKIKIKSNRFTK
jgi:hypothetical protein